MVKDGVWHLVVMVKLRVSKLGNVCVCVCVVHLTS